MVSTTKIELKVRFLTKIPLVDLDKSHVRIITNNKRVLNEIKSQQIQIHLLTSLNMYCHMRLKCDNFAHY